MAVRTAREKIWETLIANWKVWPIAQLINFSLIPLNFRVLWVNLVGILWNAIVSYIANTPISINPPQNKEEK